MFRCDVRRDTQPCGHRDPGTIVESNGTPYVERKGESGYLALERMLSPRQDVILERRIQLDEHGREAPDAYDQRLELGQIGVVTGFRREEVNEHLNRNEYGVETKIAHQKEQRGTGDALKAYFNDISEAKNTEFTVVLCGDTPLLSSSELGEIFNQFKEDPKLEGVAATFEQDNPTGYGRIVRSGPGFKIVEQKDANADQLAIKEVNSACTNHFTI